MSYPPDSAASESAPPGPAPEEVDSRPRALLTEGPIAKTLLLFSLPTLASSVLQSLNASINTMWIGRLLGEQALTASANANSLIFFLLGAVFGLGLAATVLVGQSLGSGNLDAAKRTIGTSLCFFGGISILLATLGIAFAPDVLAAMSTPPEALPLAAAYLRVIFIALPGMYLYTFAMMALRGAGDAKTPFKFLLLSAALDVGLNPILILGVGPIPPLGIAGSATATLIAQWTSLSALVFSLYRRRHFLRIETDELHYLRIDRTILRALLLKGIPMGLQIVVVSSSMLVMISLVNRFGTRTTAAYGACFQLWNYIQMPAFAVGSAVSSMVAQNVGAQLWDRVARIARAGVIYNIVLTSVLVGIATLASRSVFELFLGDSVEAVATAQHIHYEVSWSFILFGVSFVLSSVMRATGAVMAPLVILFLALWIVRLPFAYALAPVWGSEAIWWSFGVGSITSVCLCTLYYRSGRWRHAHMLQPKAA